LEQAAQGSGRVPIPGGVQKTCRCGTSGHGLAGMVVLGRWLDFMILEEPFREPSPGDWAVWESRRHQREPAGGGIQELSAELTDSMHSSTRPN